MISDMTAKDSKRKSSGNAETLSSAEAGAAL